MLNFMQVMVPEFILNEQHQPWLYRIQKTPCMHCGIHRQVKDLIGNRMRFAYFISRWRKKTNQYGMRGIQGFQLFEHRQSLFKFAEGSSVHPDHGPVHGAECFGEPAEDMFPSLYP